MNVKHPLFFLREVLKVLSAKYSKILGVTKMIQNRPNLGSGVDVGPFSTLLFLASNEHETFIYTPRRNFKGTLRKMQQEFGCFQNGKKSTESMDYSPWSGSILAYFRPSQNILFLASNEQETFIYTPQRNFKGTLSKIQQEFGCFQNRPNLWTSGVDFGPF